MCFFNWVASNQHPSAGVWGDSVAAHNHRISRLAELEAPSVIGTRPIVNDLGSRRNQAYLWTVENQNATGIREKYYLPDEEGYWEHSWYDRGTRRFDIVRTLHCRIGVLICTEMWFFEWARHYAASRADILCIPRATPHGSTDKWLAGGQAAAVCSGAYCLSSNLWCPPGAEANCGGLAWVVDPEGEILARTSENDPFATVDIDLEYSRLSKTNYPRYVAE